MVSLRLATTAIAAGLLALALAPTADAQMLDRPAQVVVDGQPKILNPDVLEGGLEPGEVLHVEFSYGIIIPGPAVCIGHLFELTYAILQRPAESTGVLSPVSEARPFQGGRSGQLHDSYTSTGGYAWDGWETRVSLAVGEDTPSGAHALAVRAQLRAGNGIASGCSVTGTGNQAVAEILVPVA